MKSLQERLAALEQGAPALPDGLLERIERLEAFVGLAGTEPEVRRKVRPPPATGRAASSPRPAHVEALALAVSVRVERRQTHRGGADVHPAARAGFIGPAGSLRPYGRHLDAGLAQGCGREWLARVDRNKAAPVHHPEVDMSWLVSILFELARSIGPRVRS